MGLEACLQVPSSRAFPLQPCATQRASVVLSSHPPLPLLGQQPTVGTVPASISLFPIIPPALPSSCGRFCWQLPGREPMLTSHSSPAFYPVVIKPWQLVRRDVLCGYRFTPPPLWPQPTSPGWLPPSILTLLSAARHYPFIYTHTHPFNVVAWGSAMCWALCEAS